MRIEESTGYALPLMNSHSITESLHEQTKKKRLPKKSVLWNLSSPKWSDETRQETAHSMARVLNVLCLIFIKLNIDLIFFS